MRTKLFTHTLAPLFALALFLSSCVKESQDLINNGGQISFTAESGYVNDSETRTEYSHVDENGHLISSSSRYERINWVGNHDMIRILCDQALDQSGQPNTAATFEISSPTHSGKESQEEASDAILISGSAPFFWGEGDHYFYALYPAAGTTSNYHTGTVTESESSIAALTGNKALITGSIPSTQGSVKVVEVDSETNETFNVYKPNMNLAYMFAAEKTESVGDVTLHFHPLVTAFEFSLKALDDQMATYDLKSLKLSSTSTDLTGGFTSTLNYNATEVATVDKASSGLGREITLNLPSGTRLSKDVFSVFTFLALGVEQTDLRLTLTFDGGGTRSLPLNKMVSDVPTPVTVGGCKKAYFKLDVGTPEWQYVIGNLYGVTVGPPGGSGNVGNGFYSYRTNGIVTEPVPYALVYWEEGATAWAYSPPAWLTIDDEGGSIYAGSVDGQTFDVTFAAQVNSATDNTPNHHAILAAVTPKVDYDLSTYDVSTLTEGIRRTTANCYVVRGPGSYKLPLIYGNGIYDGIVNEIAFHAKKTLTGSYITDDGEDFYLGYFKDHLDNNITTPYIVEQQAGKTLSAAIVWTDIPGLVTNVSLDGSGHDTYLKFNVPAETIDQGNAVVAVLADGKVAWSWHIWVTEDMGLPLHAGGGYFFAPLNLGWVDGKHEVYERRYCWVCALQDESALTSNMVQLIQTEDDIRTGYNNTFYQWGRKDPQRAAQGIMTEGEEYFYSDKFKKYYSGPGFQVDPPYQMGAVSLGTAIQNPQKFYIDTDGGNYHPVYWCNTQYFNNWNSIYNGVWPDGYPTEYDDYVTKTIYDPSPVGYVVPHLNAFSYINDTENLIWDADRKGRYYKNNPDLFFPTPGYFVEQENRGYISEYGRTCNLWCAIPYPAEYWDVYWVTGLSFNHESINQWGETARRVTGRSIRPIVE